jgi:Tol biopolymer transport system component
MPFDLESLTLKGSPLSMIDTVERAPGGGAIYFALSDTGLLLYTPTGERHQIVWVDRNGAETPISSDRAAFRIPRLSPNGKLIAVAISDETRRSDIWIYDAERGAKRRLTTEGHNLTQSRTSMDTGWNPPHVLFGRQRCGNAGKRQW